MFVMCCPSFVKLLSKNSFKRLIRPVLLTLAKDRVACVRESVLELIVDEPCMPKRFI